MIDASLFIPKNFNELIGNKKTLCDWKDYITNIKKGDIFFIHGFSGVGKTCGTKLLLEECSYNFMFLDTNNATDGRDLLDRIKKFHNRIDLAETLKETPNTSNKIIVIDEIESFIKIDRNILNSILAYNKMYKLDSIPIIIIGHNDVIKKLGDMKNYITTYLKIQRLEDIDIFLFFKKRIPKNKIKVVELMSIIEGSNGNIYSAILSIINRVNQKKNDIKPKAYVSDKQKTLNEIFECKDLLMVEKLLNDDDWMNPLKIHENIIKILDNERYQYFLHNYLYYELFISNLEGNVFCSTDIPMIYLANIIVYVITLQKTDGKIEAMEFSKLLSYISTKKKYKKLMYEKVPICYPVEDLGLYWIHNHIYSKDTKSFKNM
jgi:hypothetical protein